MLATDRTGKIDSAGVTLTGACQDVAYNQIGAAADTGDAAWGTDNGAYKCRYVCCV